MNLANILNVNGVKIIKKEDTSQSENTTDMDTKESVENVQISNSVKEEENVTDESYKKRRSIIDQAKSTDKETIKRMFKSPNPVGLIREARAMDENDREVNDVEIETYTETKEMVKDLLKDGEVNIVNAMRAMSTIEEIAHGDGNGAAAMAIAESLMPSKERDIELISKVKEMEQNRNKNTTGELYEEAVIGFELDDIKHSEGYQEALLNQQLKENLAGVASVVLEQNAIIYEKENKKPTYATETPIVDLKDGRVIEGKAEKKKYKDRIAGIIADASKEPINAELEKPKEEFVVNDTVSVIPKQTDDSQLEEKTKTTNVFDTSKIREENANRRRNSRLSMIKVAGPKVTGFLPYSNLKFEIDPTTSVIDLEDDYTEMEKLLATEGLSNVSKFITAASQHLSLLTGDKDAEIRNPKDRLRSKIHFLDFKYLILAKALSAGETKLEQTTTCQNPECGKEYDFTLDVKTLLESFPTSLQEKIQDYDANKTYEELTKEWKQVESINITKKLPTKIYDDYTKRYFNKVVYTVNFTNPTLEKYILLKDTAVSLLLYTFSTEISQNANSFANEIAMMNFVQELDPIRVARLQSIMESFAILDNILITYVDDSSGTDVSVTTDEIVVSNNMEVAKLYDLVTGLIDNDILAACRDKLEEVFKLSEMRNMIAERLGTSIENIPLPTLLDEMMQIQITNLKCPECGSFHGAEASVLNLGFSLIQASLNKIKL